MGWRTWAMTIELTFPVEADDVEERYYGDAEIDFSHRSLVRVRRHLEKLLKDSPFEHYYICEFPKRVIG